MPGRKRRGNPLEEGFAPPETKATDFPCKFCKLAIDNEFMYGKFIRKSGLHLHYFCMLFSSGLLQRGDPDISGIFGFFVADIKKELKRGAKLTCCHCKKKGATIGCSVSKCSQVFHLPCGMRANSLHQFFANYPSFCATHRPTQVIPRSDRLSFYGTANSICAICLLAVEARTSLHTLRATCCRNAWFHRICIQKMALSAGYFFKCPLCNNKKDFVMEMLTCGIYIPEQDALWELEENAYSELLYRHNSCDVKICSCPAGRDSSKENTRWQIVLCASCGSRGCHIECGRLPHYKPFWECSTCKLVSLENQKLEEKSVQPCDSAVDPRHRRISVIVVDSSSDEDEVDVTDETQNTFSGPPRSNTDPQVSGSESDVIGKISPLPSVRMMKRPRVILSDDSSEDSDSQEDKSGYYDMDDELTLKLSSSDEAKKPMSPSYEPPVLRRRNAAAQVNRNILRVSNTHNVMRQVTRWRLRSSCR